MAGSKMDPPYQEKTVYTKSSRAESRDDLTYAETSYRTSTIFRLVTKSPDRSRYGPSEIDGWLLRVGFPNPLPLSPPIHC